nr:MAG TPA: hypothetical protein [Caudoviricetes sp.]
MHACCTVLGDKPQMTAASAAVITSLIIISLPPPQYNK